jgi:hypothetical protein
MGKGPVVSTGRCRYCRLTDAHPRLRHGPQYTWEEAKTLTRGQRVVVQTYGGFDERTGKTRQRFYLGTVRQVHPAVRVREDSSGESETVTPSRLFREAPPLPDPAAPQERMATTDSYDPELDARQILDAFYRPQRSPEAATATRRLLDTYGPGNTLMEALASQDVLPMSMAEPDQEARTFYIPAEQPNAWIVASSVTIEEERPLFDEGTTRTSFKRPCWTCQLTVRCASPQAAQELAATGWMQGVSVRPVRAPTASGWLEVKGDILVNDRRLLDFYADAMRSSVPLVVCAQGLREANGEGLSPFPHTDAMAEAWCSDAAGVREVEAMMSDLRDVLELPRMPVRWQMLTQEELARIFPKRRPNGLFPQSKVAGELPVDAKQKALTRFVRMLNSTVLAGDPAMLEEYLRTYHSDRGDVPKGLMDFPLAVLRRGYVLVDPLDANGAVIAFPGVIGQQGPRPLAPKVEPLDDPT